MILLARRGMSILFAVLIAAVVLLAMQYGFVSGQATAVPARPQAVIVVNSTLDVVADDGLCTLREAVTAANLDAASGVMTGECAAGNGADVIVLSAGMYTLSLEGSGEDNNASGDLDVTSEITVQGLSEASVVIDGAALDRVWHVLPGGRLSLQNLTVRGGLATNSSGGGIYHEGELLLLDTVTMTLNAAVGGFPNGRGGGIWSSGLVTLTNAVVSENTAARDGGGFYNTGEAWLVGTSLRENTAALNGGGLYVNGGVVYVTDSTIRGNVTVFSGGGVNNQGMLYLRGSVVAQNSADLSGGGLFNSNGGVVSLDAVTLYENAAAQGGAVYTRDGQVTGVGSTFYGNTAVSGGGLYSRDSATILSNSTLSGNAASENGGGLINEAVNGEAAVNLAHVSLVDNLAVADGSGLLVVGETAVITLSNSLLTNAAVTAPYCGGAGDIISADYNLVGDASCNLSGSNDQVVSGPLVDGLADNGGATMTHALLPDSPALDHIPVGENGCGAIWTTDQRGVIRPQDDGCDVGAYEAEESPIVVYATYLPIIRSPDVLIAPDLIVQEIIVTAANVQIVIANQGTGAVVDGFWVDLYINPDPAPTQVNQTWDQLCAEGLVWGVTDTAVLTPGGTLTLTLNDSSFTPELSNFSGTFTNGMEIYVQVDSASQARDSGGVLEIHEILNQPYNNIASVVVVLP